MSDSTPNLPNHDLDHNSGSPNPNILQAFITLGEFLAEDKWYPQRIDNQYAYRMHFAGKNGDFRCFTQIITNMEQLLFYAISSARVPDEIRPAVAEFITRANYGMRIGNFEMDFSDGEVRYKSSLDFEGETLTHQLIRNTIYPAVLSMDRYLPGLLSVIYGGRTPFEAIEEIEGQKPGKSPGAAYL
ncbi:MAG: YbjN domain-containing protein [Anaerolineae bacterium]|nr:YbjN domain-containing protein [Anaerolineae bacterium]